MIVSGMLMHNDLRRIKVGLHSAHFEEHFVFALQAIQEVAKLVIGIFKCLSTQEFPGRDEVKDSKVTSSLKALENICCGSRFQMMKIKQAIAEYAESIRQDRDAAAGEDDQAGSSIFDRYRQYRPSGAIQVLCYCSAFAEFRLRSPCSGT